VANIKSAEKRWRQSLKRRARNRSARTAARTHIKTVNISISAGEPNADALKQAVRALDKAAEKGILHANNAARRKSRLMHHFAMALSGEQTATAATTRTRTRTRRASSRSRSTTGTRTSRTRKS
jgi:small subunit ribosomal protein S20